MCSEEKRTEVKDISWKREKRSEGVKDWLPAATVAAAASNSGRHSAAA
jgi:hypothetical protein